MAAMELVVRHVLQLLLAICPALAGPRRGGGYPTFYPPEHSLLCPYQRIQARTLLKVRGQA